MRHNSPHHYGKRDAVWSYNKVWLEDAAPPRITVTSHHCMHICTAQAYVKIIMRFLISALQHISDEEQPDYLNLANKHRTH